MTTPEGDTACPPSDPEEEHVAVWLDIPWYVAGTLDEDAARRVVRHAENCARCRAEIASERRLGAALAEMDGGEAETGRSWAALRARIAEEGAASGELDGQEARSGASAPVAPSMRTTGRTAARRAGTPARTRQLGFGAAIAAAAVAAVLGLMPPSDTGGPYRTLTAGDASEEAVAFRVRVADGVAPDAVAAMAGTLGLVVAEGPSPTGVYTLVPRDGQAGDPEATLARLAETPILLFATIRRGQP